MCAPLGLEHGGDSLEVRQTQTPSVTSSYTVSHHHTQCHIIIHSDSLEVRQTQTHLGHAPKSEPLVYLQCKATAELTFEKCVPMCVCVCVCLSVYVCLYVCMYVCIYIYIYIYSNKIYT